MWKRLGRTTALVCIAASAVTLTACGDNPMSRGGATGAGDLGAQAAPAAAGGSSHAGTVDVCGLLTEKDAGDVARERGLGGDSAAQATYKLTAKKVDDPGSGTEKTSACRFTISAQVDGEEVSGGVVVIQVVPGDDFGLYRSQGESVPGLGDEAAKVTGSTVVRVGDLMLQTAEDSFTDDFIVGLYRKMIPHLR